MSDGGADRPLLVAFAYRDGALPNAWFRAYKRVRRGLRRGGFNAMVMLVPAGDLPDAADVVVVPPAVSAGLPTLGGERLVAEADAVGAAWEELQARLVSDGRLRPTGAPGRTVAVHRGFLAVTDRARLSE